MDYRQAYSRLIFRATEREVLGYVERHHIVPKCLGGTDAADNIVLLTAREHFLAHKFLTRMYPANKGVWYALIAMGRLPGMRARIFASERARAAQARVGTKYSSESRAKMSLAKKGKPSVSFDTCFKPGYRPWSTGMKGEGTPGYGKRRTPEQLQRMSQAQLACGNQPPSRKGIKWTEEQKAAARIKRQASRLIGERL
jgi:hypothetical protein